MLPTNLTPETVATSNVLLQVFLLADQFQAAQDEVTRVKNDRNIATARGDTLQANWGTLLEIAFDPSFTVDKYRQVLLGLIQARVRAPSRQAIRDTVAAFAPSATVNIVDYYNNPGSFFGPDPDTFFTLNSTAVGNVWNSTSAILTPGNLLRYLGFDQFGTQIQVVTVDDPDDFQYLSFVPAALEFIRPAHQFLALTYHQHIEVPTSTRPRRSDSYWLSASPLSTFTMLSTPTITGVVAHNFDIQVSVSPSTSLMVKRSTDGGAYQELGLFTTSGGSMYEYACCVLSGGQATLPDGTQASTLDTEAAYFATPTQNPTVPFKANALVDAKLYTADGHYVIVPAGTVVTFTAGTWDAAPVPHGHTFSYEVAATNQYMTTPYSAPTSVVVSSSWSAQTLAAPTQTDNVIHLSWTDPNAYSTGDRLEIWQQVGTSGYSLLATITKSAGAMPTTYDETFDFLTLVPETYAYKLRAVANPVAFLVNPEDVGPFSSPQNIVINYSLNQITNLTATLNPGNTQVSLAWTNNELPAVEGGIYVDKAVGVNGVFKRLVSLPPGTASYVDVFTTEPGQTYSYRAYPFNALHPGPVSATASTTTPLVAPAITSVTQVGDVGTTIRWSDANQYVATYTVQRDVNGSGYSTIATIPTGGFFSFTYNDYVSLSIGNVVSYQIRASNAGNVGPYSAPVSLKISSQIVAPTNLVATFVDFRRINLAWSSPNPSRRGANIFRSVNGGAFSQIARVDKGYLAYTDTFQTAPGFIYAYQVQDFNNQEIGPLSGIALAYSELDAQPLQLTPNPPNYVTLQWGNWAIPNATQEDYTSIERAWFGGPFYEIAQVPLGQSPTYSASLIGGTPGTTTQFRVRKVKNPFTMYGNVTVPTIYGFYSNVVSTASPLTTPSGVTVTRPRAGVNRIAWTDADTTVTGFTISRQTTLNGITSPMVQIAMINDPAVRSYDDVVEFIADQSFAYTIGAFNATTSSVYSGYGTLSAALPILHIEVRQTQRNRMEIDLLLPVGYVYIPGDTVQVFRSVDGAAATVIANITTFSTGFLYNDDDVAVGQSLAYSAGLFNPTKVGDISNTVTIVVADVVDTPLGTINQVRSWGSHTFEVGNGVIAVGSGGVSKVVDDPGTGVPVLTSNTGVANIQSVASGDLTRLVAFSGTRPTPNAAYLLDASDLSVVSSTPLNQLLTYTWLNGTYVIKNITVALSTVFEGANTDGNSTGIYTGWIMENDYPLIYPWVSDLSSITLLATYDQGYSAGVYSTNLFNFSGDPSVLVDGWGAHAEVLRGDLVVSNYNRFYRVSRDSSYTNFTSVIPEAVFDWTSDGNYRIYVVTVKGNIWAIDFGHNASNPRMYVCGRLSGARDSSGNLPFTVGDPDHSVSIEIAGGSRVVVCIANHLETSALSYPIDHSAFHVFDVVVSETSFPVVTTIALNERAKQPTSVEFIKGMAFDTGSYVYAASETNPNRLIRINLA